MAVQFAGSGSTADRRRRRLAVGADANVDAAVLDGEGGDIESQLVASAAAGPWVPVSEFRIWVYAAVIGVGLGALTFVLFQPIDFPIEFKPLAEHLLGGTRPTAVVSVETVFLALSTQLAVLICWYRARCKLDFGGRYRVWPWVVALIGLGAACAATNIHLDLGEVLGRSQWLPWRGSTVAWLLPFCIAALPITLLIDRDVRNSTSSLLTLRLSGLLWLAGALFEIYRPELRSKEWFDFAQRIVPVYASATLFVGLWLHARIVAYVCPDPPELDERSAWSLVKSALIWIGCRLIFWRRTNVEARGEDEDEAKPKRRRKKSDGDDAAVRRKRRTPAKRPASRTRTRTKSTDEEFDDSGDAPSDEQIESMDGSVTEPTTMADSSGPEGSYDETDESSTASAGESPLKTNGRSAQIQVHKSHGSGIPAPHSHFQWNNRSETEESDDDDGSQASGSNDETDDEQQDPLDARISPEQLKGLSKRQKRDLRKQLRDQQRTRGR